MSEEQHTPLKKFSTGVINASVWKNNGVRNGENIEFFSVSLERRYKAKSGEWKSTNSLGLNDLPKAQLVLAEAYRFIALKERQDEEPAA